MQPTMSVEYSICATHYNNQEWLEESAGALAEEIKGLEQWEFVISDAGSTDGSLDYLYKLESNMDNFHIISKEGMNIGQGRRVAAENAKGEILFQIADLDGVHFTDGRLFDMIEFYEELLEEKGELQLNIGGAFIITSNLLEDIGNWHDLEVAEEREIIRRLIREEKILFCPIEIIKYSAGRDKNLAGRVKRSYKNAIAKFNSGARLRDLVYLWIRKQSGPISTTVALTIFPVAWIAHLFDSKDYDTYDNYDIHLAKKPRDLHPELCIEPPENLENYRESPNT